MCWLAALRVQRRLLFLAAAGAAGLTLALTACSSSPSRATRGQEAAPPSSPGHEEPPTIGGQKRYGPFIQLAFLGASAWDGRRVWLTDSEHGRLLAIDGDSGKVVVDSQVDWFSDAGSMAVADGELWTIAQDPDGGNVRILRIDTDTGYVEGRTIDGGRPLGQALRQDKTLLAADYERAIASIDPSTGGRQVKVQLDLIPNLFQLGPTETYWVVDDNRARVLRVDGQGKHLVDSTRGRYVAGIVTDGAGNAWLAERSAVAALNPAGETIREVEGFKNVVAVLSCEGAVVVSDIESGQLAWFDASGRDQRVETGTSGRAIACAPNGVWFVTADGYLTRVTTPTNR